MHAPELDAAMRRTFDGQAHWGGWNAPNEPCRNCRSWCGSSKASQAVCAVFVDLTGVISKKVPADAWACRHFEKWDEESERIAPAKKRIAPVRLV
jgi:hypothetical protein